MAVQYCFNLDLLSKQHVVASFLCVWLVAKMRNILTDVVVTQWGVPWQHFGWLLAIICWGWGSSTDSRYKLVRDIGHVLWWDIGECVGRSVFLLVWFTLAMVISWVAVVSTARSNTGVEGCGRLFVQSHVEFLPLFGQRDQLGNGCWYQWGKDLN